jgi:hypothetical protein
METFRDSEGTLYRRPADIQIGNEVGIIGDHKEVVLSGTVSSMAIIDREIWVQVDVGGKVPIPRKLNELAIPIV